MIRTFRGRLDHLAAHTAAQFGIKPPEVYRQEVARQGLSSTGLYAFDLSDNIECRKFATIVVTLARYQRCTALWVTNFYRRTITVLVKPADTVHRRGTDRRGYWSGPCKASEALTEVEHIDYTKMADFNIKTTWLDGMKMRRQILTCFGADSDQKQRLIEKVFSGRE